MADGALLDRVQEALASGPDTRWSLLLTGEEPWTLLKELLHDLNVEHGKKIATKFSYIGMAPTIAWANACSDLFYPVMRESIHAFDRYWRPIAATLKDQGFHYVSLGVGTGQKDRVVLRDLTAHQNDALYVPIDLSAEMLRLGIEETRKLDGLRMLPVQLDFSSPANLDELRSLLHRLVGDAPILFALLGNTVANADEDRELASIVSDLLRPQDRLLLEVATTSDVSELARQEAIGEYANSGAYRVHATSALGQFTDLTIDNDLLRFRSVADESRGIRIETHYENVSDQPTFISLPNRERLTFRPAETIRLTLSRKYLPAGVDELISSAQLVRQSPRQTNGRSRGQRPVFGSELMLLSRGTSLPTQSSAADELLRGGKRARR